MLGNDQYGDCSVAGMLHIIMTWLANAGTAPVVFTTQQAVELYFQLTGGSDNGLALETVLKFFQQTGWNGYEIGPYLAIDPSDQETISRGHFLLRPALLRHQPACRLGTEHAAVGRQRRRHDRRALRGPHRRVGRGPYHLVLGPVARHDLPRLHQYCDEMYVILAPAESGAQRHRAERARPRGAAKRLPGTNRVRNGSCQLSVVSCQLAVVS